MGRTKKISLNFTVKNLDALAPAKTRFNVFDSQTRSLGLVVHPSGTKNFFHLKKISPLSSVDRKDVIDLHAQIGAAHGEVTANRTLTFAHCSTTRQTPTWPYGAAGILRRNQRKLLSTS